MLGVSVTSAERSRPSSGHVTRAAIALVLLLPVAAPAQDVTEPALKAAFIYNFAKFTEWPADVVPVAEPFLLCVLGDAAVGDALERTVKGRMLGRHSLAVVMVTAADPHRMCHVLYVSGITAAQATALVTALQDLPVLTIGDVGGFVERGGIAHFFFERGQLRFAVAVGSARRARLLISSRLLALAKQP